MLDESRSKAYYDHFSASYEAHRSRGYHALIDALEVDLAHRYCGGDLLEAGCGTGLILSRLAPRSRRAVGVDLSAGMLARARERGLEVVQSSIDSLPFADASFDTVVSFKVLAHIPNIEQTVAELARVTRPGGHLLLEFYNRRSLRTLIKRLKPPTRVGTAFNDEDVYTRFDTLRDIRGYLPRDVELVDVRGVRVLTPLAGVYALPGLSQAFTALERLAADAPLLKHLGGFLIAVLQKQG